ncbi:MAG: T9SS type A sorting domain-containing protein [Flavobacteriales bacterium]|nr:T9SS type A sorting domain-containing protein [Flavobacteriales bacterium]
MKRRYFLFPAMLCAVLLSMGNIAHSQGLRNAGAKINITSGAYLNVTGTNGGFTNLSNASATADVVNAGTFRVQGNWTNNDAQAVFGSSPGSGVVVLDGGTQNIGGSEETHFYDLQVGGSNRKILTGTSNATGATVFGAINLQNQSLELNQKTLTIENDLNTSIAQSGNGRIISETYGSNVDDYGRVRWNIGTTVDTYSIPFGTDEATPQNIVFVYDIQQSGTPASPYRSFATYATDDNNSNSYIPYSVTHLTDNEGFQNGSSIIDRFWLIDEENTGVGVDGTGGNTDDPAYGASPNPRPIVYYTFTYSDDDFTGNSITASQITPQRFNHDENRWLDWMYSDDNPPFPSPWVFNNDPGNNQLTMTVGADASTWEEDMYPIWTLVDNSDPLPIELVRFVGQCDGENVELRWTTWTETNNDFFTLERSLNGEDFETVDILNGAGNSNQPISYELVDQNAFSGTSYYRLKMTDTYGKISYSSVIVVTCGDGSIDFNFVNAYDVDHTEIVVEFTAHENEDFNILLFDAAGRRALDYSGVAINGMNKVRLPSGSLAQGIYVINLNNNIKNYSKKVLLH